MSEQFHTADLGLPYQSIPRIDTSFVMQPDSYVDLMLPNDANSRSRLRLYDVNERWLRAVDLSSIDGYVPSEDEQLSLPSGAFDNFELDQEFFIGRDHNPDTLPVLDKNVVSRNHLSLRVSLGTCGIILAIKDLGSHNGTEVILNSSLTTYEQPLLATA